MDKSTYARNAVLDALLNNVSLAVASVHVSLHTADPGLTGASEVTGGSYARQTGSFGAASGGSSSSDAVVEFEDMPAVTVTYMGLWDAATAGNFLYRGQLDESKVVNAGDTVRFQVGDITVQET